MLALREPPPVEPLVVREQTSAWTYVWVGLFAAAITALVIAIAITARHRDRGSASTTNTPTRSTDMTELSTHHLRPKAAITAAVVLVVAAIAITIWGVFAMHDTSNGTTNSVAITTMAVEQHRDTWLREQMPQTAATPNSAALAGATNKRDQLFRERDQASQAPTPPTALALMGFTNKRAAMSP